MKSTLAHTRSWLPNRHFGDRPVQCEYCSATGKISAPPGTPRPTASSTVQGQATRKGCEEIRAITCPTCDPMHENPDYLKGFGDSLKYLIFDSLTCRHCGAKLIDLGDVDFESNAHRFQKSKASTGLAPSDTPSAEGKKIRDLIEAARNVRSIPNGLDNLKRALDAVDSASPQNPHTREQSCEETGLLPCPRPNWRQIYGYEIDNRAQELVSITRHTAELAIGALKEELEREYYHNSAAACRELSDALTSSGEKHAENQGCAGGKEANLSASALPQEEKEVTHES